MNQDEGSGFRIYVYFVYILCIRPTDMWYGVEKQEGSFRRVERHKRTWNLEDLYFGR